MKLSIVIPFYNEKDNVVAVLDEIKQAQPDAEIIAVDDGSSDGTAELLEKQSGIRIVRHAKNLGQSAALYTGLTSSTGDICVMMDGDGQNDPSDIGKLVENLNQADLACGYRAKRQDKWTKKVASRIANKIRSTILCDGIRDTGCTLKAMRREHVQYLVPFNGLHRFIPALLRNSGLSIIEVPVNHRPRRAGTSKYTIGGRALRGIFDLIGVYWLLKRRIRW